MNKELRVLTWQNPPLEDASVRVEQTFRQRAERLEADYRELEEFAYALAHKLRTPLRHMDSLLEVFRKLTNNHLEPKSRSCLANVTELGHQLDGLVDELLAFTQIGQAELHEMHFSLADFVSEIIQEHHRETEGRHIQWVMGELPEVVGDPVLLGQALTHLIANAIKFTSPRKQARIEIGSTPAERERIVFVADNGIGFDPHDRPKLFGVFQRLHPQEQFGGLGVGLAKVRRIIQRHGGRTWAEGVPEQGACFYFSLPCSGAGAAEDLAGTLQDAVNGDGD